MYVSGQKDTLEISFDEVVLREVIDQFGQDHPVKKDFENRYHLTIEDVLISDGLIGWLMMLQDHVKVIKPYSLQEKMKNISFIFWINRIITNMGFWISNRY